MRTIRLLLCFVFTTFVIAGCQKYCPFENKPPVVAAGPDTTYDMTKTGISDIHLTGAATDADGKVVSYLWSQVSGPNTAKIKNPGDPTTSVSGLTSGEYVFQLMATDNKGATGVDTVTVTIMGAHAITITLQSPDDVTDLHFIYNHFGGSNDPTAKEIGATAWTFDGIPAYQRGLLKFNLSKLPAGAKIQSAHLSLYSNPNPQNGDLVHANSGTNNAMLIQRVTSNWDMTTVWETQPGTVTASQIVVPHTAEPFLDLTGINVTNLIKKMVQENNYGFLIKLQNETYYNSRIFCSTKYPDASKRPKLVLKYTE